jgi:DNA polymerase-3 subunit epsilon
MDEYVINIHGISNDVLVDKPVFSAIFNEFMSFINGSELIIHHANFDINFFNSEFIKMGINYLIEDKFKITDTRIMAKTKYPNEKMSVDALCHLMNIEHNSGDIDDGLAYCENVANIYLSLIGKTS